MVLSEEWMWLSKVSPNGGRGASLVGLIRWALSCRREDNGMYNGSRVATEYDLISTGFWIV